MSDGTRRAPLPVARAARRAKPYNALWRAPAARVGSAQRSLPPRSGLSACRGRAVCEGLRGAVCVDVCALPLLQVLRSDPRNVKAMYRLACALEVRRREPPPAPTHAHTRPHAHTHAEKARSCWHAHVISLHARVRMRVRARARAHKVVRIHTPYRRALHGRSRCTGPHATALRLEPDWRRGYHPEADVGEGRAQPRFRLPEGWAQSRCGRARPIPVQMWEG
jgi:hypothetical protein